MNTRTYNGFAPREQDAAAAAAAVSRTSGLEFSIRSFSAGSESDEKGRGDRGDLITTVFDTVYIVNVLLFYSRCGPRRNG